MTYLIAGTSSNLNKTYQLTGEDAIEDNLCSKVGKVLEWPVTQLPREIANYFRNPKVITVALTITAMAIVQFAFYPVATALAVKFVATWIAAHISYSTIHFGLYLLCMGFVLGNGMLAFGRFSNAKVLELIQRQLNEAQAQQAS